MANHLTMHDSANIQRRSINRLLQRGFRAAVSQTSLLRKLHPRICVQNGPWFPKRHPSGNRTPLFRRIPGRVFPLGHLGETESRVQNGTHFPGAPKQPPATQPKWSAFLRRVCIKTKLRWNSSCLGLNQQNRNYSTATAKPALATNVTCAGLVGTHKGTL